MFGSFPGSWPNAFSLLQYICLDPFVFRPPIVFRSSPAVLVCPSSQHPLYMGPRPHSSSYPRTSSTRKLGIKVSRLFFPISYFALSTESWQIVILVKWTICPTLTPIMAKLSESSFLFFLWLVSIISVLWSPGQLDEAMFVPGTLGNTLTVLVIWKTRRLHNHCTMGTFSSI